MTRRRALAPPSCVRAYRTPAFRTPAFRTLALRTLALAAAALAVSSCAKGGASAGGGGYGTEAKPISFAIISAESANNLAPLWTPVLEDLKHDTGVVMKPFFASNYSLSIEAMRAHKVQAAWFPALSSLEAARRAGGQVVDRAVNNQGGAYRSVLIVRKGSGVTLDQVKACGRKLTFGLGDAKSTSGTLAPMAYLFTPAGIDPATCFKQVRSASHQANLLAVANGVLQVATNNTVGLLFAQRENPDVAAKVETIWTSPDLPEAAIVVRPSDLDPAVTAKITDFFAGYGKGAGPDGERRRKILDGLTYVGFAKADNGYLLPVRQMEASTDLAEARRGGDPGKIREAQARYDALQGPNPAPIAPVAGA